jgi:preprotein translocase subunit SecB
MTDNNQENQQQGDMVPNSPVMIRRQYLKDLSFENPNSPEILKRGNERPEMDMNILMDVRKLEDEESEHFYEVTLTLQANAVREGQAMFVAEVTYGAAVSIDGLDEKRHHPLLLTEVPQILFPFARLALANATQAGGFMPLQLQPVDFRTMYLQRFADKQEGKDASEDASN